MAAQTQPNMDEILSSIRSTLEEETAKGAAGEAGTGDVLMLEEELSDDEILALTEQELAGTGAGAAENNVGTEEGLIDLAAFTASGNVTNATGPAPDNEDVLGTQLTAQPTATPIMPAVVKEAKEIAPAQVAETLPAAADAPAAAPAAEELDRLMDQIKQDHATPHAEKVDVLLGDAPLPGASTPLALTPPQLPETRLELPALHGVSGLQVALPSAVLAEALRPLITSWLSENLPDVVERLVQAEIAKLTKL